MKWLNLFKVNIKREVILLKRYLPNTISMILTFYIIFLGMFFGIQVVGDPGSAEMNTQYVIVNYIFWYLSMAVMAGIGWTVQNEVTLGTLEQIYMSPLGAWRIFLARIISSTVVEMITMTIMLFVSMLTAGTWLNIDIIAILPILILMIVSMLGVSFMIAGAAVIFKQIGSFLQISQFIFAGLTFVPLSTAPFLEFAPIVKGVDMVRQIMIFDYSWTDFTVVDYSSLILNAILYFALGIFVFFRCERVAMEKGVLGQH
ncbi:ABC transporter permease [Caldibacillus lycopersici]|uniref:ABC transporter permease n=1 Tax=Perspicuibacillus lycopersici TaxID=1325689 RepID=A0AAE3IWX4_9BACI|nr:ABC transporter permease [Perspicuibacillus lycopersici]MCU9615093.1 ABC transporter permease [Perspicuibacillus lycopersici]